MRKPNRELNSTRSFYTITIPNALFLACVQQPHRVDSAPPSWLGSDGVPPVDAVVVG